MRAWRRAERLLGSLGGLPADLALSSLDRPASPQRRAMLARLAALLALAPASWLGWQLNERQGWSADFHSPIGQRRQLTLLDGSQVTLNDAYAGLLGAASVVKPAAPPVGAGGGRVAIGSKAAAVSGEGQARDPAFHVRSREPS